MESTGRSSSLRIFLSYAHDAHAALAERLVSDLKAGGHEVWYDRERLLAGTDWEARIEQGLDWTSAEPGRGRVLLLMTPHGLRKPDGFCLNELARAQERGLPIVPVMVAWVEPPLSIARQQWLDMRDCDLAAPGGGRYAARLKVLMKALAGEELDLEGTLRRLEHVFEPIAFEVDLAEHLRRFTGRQWIVARIDAWLQSRDALRVLWIAGEPGSGKTALACSLAAHHPAFKAFHLCRHNTERSNPKRCVLSLVYQLASRLPEYQSRLATLNVERLVKEANAETLFDRLLLQPLIETCPAQAGDIVLLVDALDEATRGTKNELATALASSFRSAPSWLRLVVTSRPEPPLTEILGNFEHLRVIASSAENLADIHEFLARELTVPAGEADPAGRAIRTIISRSEGLFLYIEFVRREIAAGRLSLAHPDEFPKGLDGMFREYFERQFPDIASYRSEIRSALELVLAAQDPLPLSVLAEFLGWKTEYRMRDFVDSLGALFREADGSLRVFHKDLRDWLLDHTRAGPFFVSVKDGHRKLARRGWDAYRRPSGPPAPPGKEPPDLVASDALALNELAYHLANTGDTEDRRRLAEYLSDIDVFVQLYWKNMYDVLGCWNALDDKPGFLRRFAENLEQLERDPDASARCAAGFRTFGLFRYHEEMFVEAEPFLERAAGFLSESNDALLLAATLNDLGECYAKNGKLDQAEAAHRRALDIRRRLLTDYHDDTAESVNNLGHVFFYWGQYDEAEGFYREALEMRQVVLPANHPKIAESYNNLGVVADARHDSANASVLFRRAVQIMQVCGLEETWEAAIYVTHDAGAALRQGDRATAEAGYTKAFQVRRKIYGYGVPITVLSLFELAALLALQGKRTETENLLSGIPGEAAGLMKSENYLELLFQLARKFMEGQHELEAGAFLEWLPGHFRTLFPSDGEAALALLIATAAYDETQGRHQQAVAKYGEALAAAERVHGLRHGAALRALCGLGRALRLNEELEKSMGRYAQAIGIGEGLLQESGVSERPDFGQICCLTAIAHNEVAFHKHVPARDWRQAEAAYRRAIELIRGSGGPIDLANMELNLQTVLHRSGAGADLEKVRRLRSILKEIGDPRAAKGGEILKDEGEDPEEGGTGKKRGR